MRGMRRHGCWFLLALGALPAVPAVASATWTRPARIGPLLPSPGGLAVASAGQVTAIVHTNDTGPPDFHAEIRLELRRGAAFAPSQLVAATNVGIARTAAAVATDGTVAVGYSSSWIDPADPFAIQRRTFTFRVRSAAGAWSAEQRAQVPLDSLGGVRLTATPTGFLAMWGGTDRAGTHDGVVLGRYARSSGLWMFTTEGTRPLSTSTLGPDGSIAVTSEHGTGTMIRVRGADGHWGAARVLTGAMGTTFGGVAALGSSRFAVWTCIRGKHPTTTDPVCTQFRVAIASPARVLTAVVVRPRRTGTFHLSPAPLGFGDAFTVTGDRGRALVLWTQRSSRGRKGEREIRTLTIAASTRRAPVPKLLGRIARTAAIDVATAPDGRAVALVLGSVKACGPSAGSGDARYAAAAVRTHGRFAGLRRITCEADAGTMQVAGTARGFLADWFRTNISSAGFRGAVTISTFR